MLSYSSKCFDLEKLESLQRMKLMIPVSEVSVFIYLCRYNYVQYNF